MNDLITTAGQAPVSQSQAGLLAHVTSKAQEAQEGLNEAEAALDYARAHKWNTQQLRAVVNRNRKQLEYLEKARMAVEAGYVIMPAINGSAFAVRIGAKATLPEGTTSTPEWGRKGDSISEVHTDSPPAGEGKYVAPECEFICDWYECEKDGKVTKYRHDIGTDFISAIPFPAVMAKPVLMDATERAMALKIFDDIGIFPGRRIRNADPIIYGRIIRPTREPLFFLICWLVRREDI